MPRNSSTVPAVVPRTSPSSMRTIGLPPPDAGDATALAMPTARTVAATLTADTANNAARRRRRIRVVFMLRSLGPAVVGTVFGLGAQSRDWRDSSPQWRTLVRALAGHWSKAGSPLSPPADWRRSAGRTGRR